jgi:hypothetical protein
MKHNCKIKDNSLNITVREIEPTRINKIGRNMVTVKQWIKTTFKLPNRTRVVRLSNHVVEVGQKENKTVKKLDKSIIIEYRYYEGKQILKTKTDINLKCLLPL